MFDNKESEDSFYVCCYCYKQYKKIPQARGKYKNGNIVLEEKCLCGGTDCFQAIKSTGKQFPFLGTIDKIDITDVF